MLSPKKGRVLSLPNARTTSRTLSLMLSPTNGRALSYANRHTTGRTSGHVLSPTKGSQRPARASVRASGTPSSTKGRVFSPTNGRAFSHAVGIRRISRARSVLSLPNGRAAGRASMRVLRTTSRTGGYTPSLMFSHVLSPPNGCVFSPPNARTAGRASMRVLRTNGRTPRPAKGRVLDRVRGSRMNAGAQPAAHEHHSQKGQSHDDLSRDYHTPVMCREVVELLAGVPAGVLLDATVGGGGHAAAVLQAAPQLDLIGIDRDPQAVRAASERLAGFGDRVVLRHARFDSIPDVLDRLGRPLVAACLFDLGVSSAQLDRPERGFSYRLDGPLDMRMDPSTATTAADIVNHADQQHLASILFRNADERRSRRIAAAIVAARPLTTTKRLAEVVAGAFPGDARRRSHPARRTFQALRIEVNNELEILDTALSAAISRLVGNGRCAVLAYHSGEDRIVKSVFRRAAGETAAPGPGLPPPPGAEASVRLLGRRARRPAESETAGNRRAAAARLRAVERLQNLQPGQPNPRGSRL